MTRQDSKSRLISVILPVYNGELILRECVKSVLEQAYSNIELIIVDDCSSDKSCAILEEFSAADSRVRFLRHEKNKGGAAARNTAIRNAKGEYAAFIDQDDVWHENKLETQLAFIEQNDCDVLSCGVEYRQLINKRELVDIPKITHFKSRQEQVISFLKSNLIPSFSCVLVKRPVFEKAGLLDEQYTGCDDYDLWLRCAEKCKICFQRELLVTKYETKSNYSWQNTNRMLEETVRIKSKYFDLYGVKGKEKSLSCLYISAGIKYWIQGDRRNIRECSKKAMCLRVSGKAVFLYLISFLPKNLVAALARIIISIKCRVLGTRSRWLINTVR